MYKGASNKAQRKAERITPKDAAPHVENLDASERIAFLKEELRRVDAEIVQTHPKSNERKMLGTRKRILADEMTALKGARKKYPDISTIFWEVARRMLPKETFDQLNEEAKHVYEIRFGKKP